MQRKKRKYDKKTTNGWENTSEKLNKLICSKTLARELLILRAPLASSPVSLTLLIFLVLCCVIFSLLCFVCLHSVTWPNVVCFFWIVHFTNIYIQIVDSIKYILGMFLLRKSYIYKEKIKWAHALCVSYVKRQVVVSIDNSNFC
jgi:hypothetical protein